MPTRHFAIITSVVAAFMVVSILFIDRPLAFFIHNDLSTWTPVFEQVTHVLEILSGFEVSRYLPGFVAFAIAAGLYVVRRDWLAVKPFVFVAIVFTAARFLAGILKPVFERMRPFDLVAANDTSQTFFIAGGSAFPSGHAAHFWGVFLPLMMLFPRYWVPLAVVPITASVARVMENDHYLGDVLGSGLLAFIIAFALWRAFGLDHADRPSS